ncbi:TPA: reverse transcriptase domain-containing protein [Pseudomonas aeruginosa]|uniref:reverse transcriptase/maturase family protein n=1 Tax=Pseudomonas aeruginosa TaxID=287 RepID=UPI00053DC86A|nr:reverse transcriptase/maturase family protein [Pseudomonas aeruginosa]HBO5169933.1 group II intron reverse transcriptase domain-containing protein [Pseudomonas aeruginosa]HBP6223126.1 RNA-dependent DNA polymerase [Pseudomonas aeruginosa]HBP6230333.1 RNA-dependent DNA polymerase [Pseudomonas aeruginosa]
MSAKIHFNKAFAIKHLESIYSAHIVLSRATGIDNLTQRQFWRTLQDQIAIISRKANAGNYTFTKYKLKLVSKGRGKPPREISIPTIRDRICLRALCEVLTKTYQSSISFDLPQDTVRIVKSCVESGKYDSFIKLDVSDFYPSIDHHILLKKLRSKIRSPIVLNLIKSAITTPTVSKSSKSDSANKKGVPQGLSISNALAAIYLIDIDKKFSNIPNAQYFRYVDDILILCNDKQKNNITRQIIKEFKSIDLTVHDPIVSPAKSSMGKLGERFDYLGYEFRNDTIKNIITPITTARAGSIEKLKESLASIFTGYKHSKIKSLDFLTWRLNMRITGCVFQEKSRGWLFFFSEIKHETLLHQLDLYVDQLIKRFNVKISPKSFVRAFYEINRRRHITNYVPNFDRYTIPQMTAVLTDYFNKSVTGLTDEEIEYEFKKRIDRQSRELLVDLATNSSAS